MMIEIDYFSCIMLFIIIALVIMYIRHIFKMKDLKDQLASSNKEAESLRGKISMIEYHHRNYVEGKNPYTVMRNIREVLEGYQRYKDDK